MKNHGWEWDQNYPTTLSFSTHFHGKGQSASRCSTSHFFSPPQVCPLLLRSENPSLLSLEMVWKVQNNLHTHMASNVLGQNLDIKSYNIHLIFFKNVTLIPKRILHQNPKLPELKTENWKFQPTLFWHCSHLVLTKYLLFFPASMKNRFLVCLSIFYKVWLKNLVTRAAWMSFP